MEDSGNYGLLIISEKLLGFRVWFRVWHARVYPARSTAYENSQSNADGTRNCLMN